LQTQEIDRSKSSQNFKFLGQKIGCPNLLPKTKMQESSGSLVSRIHLKK